MSNIRDAVLNSYKTVIEMFEAREKPDIVAELKALGTNELDALVKSKTTFKLDFSTLRIIYSLEAKLKAQDIRKLIEDTQFDQYLVIIKEKTTATNIKSMLMEGKQTQVFEIRELQFNISNHRLVPKHRLIRSDDDTINSLFQKLNIKSRAQLPVILKTDPMAKFLNAKSGDLIEITRASPTCGDTVFYRICV